MNIKIKEGSDSKLIGGSLITIFQSTYNKVLSKIGFEPNGLEDSWKKVAVSWVTEITFNDEHTYTLEIYDWKNYTIKPDEDPDEVYDWHIGGRFIPTPEELKALVEYLSL